jgi:hypothetical protein
MSPCRFSPVDSGEVALRQISSPTGRQRNTTMKVLLFTISHEHLEDLMGQRAIARLYKLVDLGRDRDHYEVTALVREEHLDNVIAKSADRPRWVKWPEGA